MNPFTADLTLRLRNPLAWTVRHPLQAIRRAGRLIVTLALSL